MSAWYPRGADLDGAPAVVPARAGTQFFLLPMRVVLGVRVKPGIFFALERE